MLTLQRVITILVIAISAFSTAALNLFGVNYDSKNNPYGQWVVLTQDGSLSVGQPSNTFGQSSGTCANAFNGTNYVVNDANGYQVVGESGTIAEVTFSGHVFEVVSWCYSSRLNKYVGIGWHIGAVLVETRTHVYSVSGDAPAIFGVNADGSGNVSVLVAALS